MVNFESQIPAVYDRAEGSLDNRMDEQSSTVQTSTMPAVRISADASAPTAETGVVAAVVVGGEGKDSAKKDAQDATRTTAETQVAAETQEAATTTPSILIIEDSTELAEIIEATLQRINLKTAHETHGTRALTRFNEMKPDVVLLDIGLPDMTGWKLLDHIKEVKGDAKMPAIIVITAYGDPANRLVGKLQNVHDYLIKPFTADEVERVVLSAVNGAAR